jgi:hypothetical protein
MKKLLESLDHDKERYIQYVNYEDARHDVPAWGTAMPAFLLWEWGRALRQAQDDKTQERMNNE